MDPGGVHGGPPRRTHSNKDLWAEKKTKGQYLRVKEEGGGMECENREGQNGDQDGRDEKGECVSARTGSIAITDTACYFPPIFIRSINPISSLISSSGME